MSFLGQAIREIFLIVLLAHVGEGQDGDGLIADRDRGRGGNGMCWRDRCQMPPGSGGA